LKTVELSADLRYKNHTTLGLLHKAINICFGSEEVTKRSMPKDGEKLDTYVIKPLIKIINDEEKENGIGS
jgi:hypothetical protein